MRTTAQHFSAARPDQSAGKPVPIGKRLTSPLNLARQALDCLRRPAGPIRVARFRVMRLPGGAAWGTYTTRGSKLAGMARTTGLEPATSGVTGRHSNQLSYVPALEGGEVYSRLGRRPTSYRAWPRNSGEREAPPQFEFFPGNPRAASGRGESSHSRPDSALNRCGQRAGHRIDSCARSGRSRPGPKRPQPPPGTGPARLRPSARVGPSWRSPAGPRQ